MAWCFPHGHAQPQHFCMSAAVAERFFWFHKDLGLFAFVCLWELGEIWFSLLKE